MAICAGRVFRITEPASRRSLASPGSLSPGATLLPRYSQPDLAATRMAPTRLREPVFAIALER